MPIKKASWKDLRKSKKSAGINKSVKRSLQKLEKSIAQQVAAKVKAPSLELMKLLYKGFDKAAQRGVISKSAAQRKKSRLMKQLR